MLCPRLRSARLALQTLVTTCLLVGWLSAGVLGQGEGPAESPAAIPASPAAIPAESPAVGSGASATSGDPSTGSPPASPILEALAYVPSFDEPASDPTADAPIASAGSPLVIGFADWSALKARHGGAQVDGKSPADEREALLRVIAASEAVSPWLDTLEVGVDEDLDDPTARPGEWGWERLDLLWELRAGPTVTVLRFVDASGSDGLRAQVEARGLAREEPLATGGGADSADTAVDTADAAYRPAGLDGYGMTFTDGGRTVIIERGGSGQAIAALAASRDPLEVAAGPWGRTASQLGQPLVARLYRGQDLCSGTGGENALLRGASARLAASVGRMRPYEALGVGYTASEPDQGIRGRYVFDYARARHAASDVAGRRALLERGSLASTGRRDEADGLRLADANAIGRDIVLEVEAGEPASEGQARRLFDALVPGPRGEPALLGICGPPPSDEPLTRQPTAGVPIFAGPASLALSGGRGIHRWGLARFGSDEVHLRATLRASDDPCALWLAATDAGSGDADEAGANLASLTFTAVPAGTTSHVRTLPVDYATASLGIESSCDSWTLRLEPVEDPGLPFTLRERFYPVHGETIAQIAPQADQAKDGFAAYASWQTDWRYESEPEGEVCTVDSGSIRLSATITYPRWDPQPGADPRAIAEWRRFIRDLTTHELGHVTIALQGADAIDELLDSGISAESCDEAERAANRAAHRLHERYDRLNVGYDRETDHGRVQGASLD